ncbi:hypothetical protein, variant [Cryptococcus neoformans var. grubii H99]|uniref:Uncharacterized protein n=1 Tax=Cryptococcus neoformans (strain H99 / ATCC 208821 / CBS 10515 / FGSC 9487) TaxID=235443 RepID=T2BNC9_CRYN9|nr:hypothetical protein, variant [Cryptococcus neoformans var. grubii H99]AGV14680.1 hypothetical protein, variant [Cryptococcus neoformans var. grubii H99]AUB27752.1 hypothetical protein CKF44_01493 [Cryptococcus neoformans var. grubii]|eukprot:XP_012052558.1 hypothetical protein, variant [Cryptococcus neoformans var. grubii H99]
MQQPFARLSRLLIYNSSRPFSPLRGAVIRTRRLYSTEIPPPPPVTPTPSGNAKRRWGLVFIIAGLVSRFKRFRRVKCLSISYRQHRADMSLSGTILVNASSSSLFSSLILYH